MRDEDFDERTRRYWWPWDLYRALTRVRPDIIQGPEPLSLLMLPFLVTTLIYLWRNPGSSL